MVVQAMGGIWNTYGIQLPYVALLILLSEIHGCYSLNSQGLALLEYRAKITSDPFKALANWNPLDSDPCLWSGVQCVDEVQILDLSGHSLEGTLAPELKNLVHLRILILSKNNFSGVIPKQFGQFAALEVLDLRDNIFVRTIPAEIGGLKLLKRLLLTNNNFEGKIPLAITRLNHLTELQYDENLSSIVAAEEVGYINRKVGKRFESESFRVGACNFCDYFGSSNEPHTIQRMVISEGMTRRKLAEQSFNLAAEPAASSDVVVYHPTSRSSGSFSAVPIKKHELSHPHAPAPSNLQPSPIEKPNLNGRSSGSSGHNTGCIKTLLRRFSWWHQESVEAFLQCIKCLPVEAFL